MHETFSWKLYAKKAQDKHVFRAHQMIKTNPSFQKQHPDWVRDAAKNNYIIMDKTIREETIKKQDNAIARRLHFAGKD